VYLAEDALSVVRERAETLARHRGLPLAEVNLHVITASRLRLDQPTDRSRLFETARRLRPRMLLLDPLPAAVRQDEILLTRSTPEVMLMYRLLFRRMNTDEDWSEGAEFSDERLTAEARDLLTDRYARDGLETRFERVPDDGGEER